MKRGTAEEVVGDYEETQLKRFDESSYVMERSPEEVRNKSFYFSRVEMLNTKGENTTMFKYNEKLVLIVDFAGEPKGESYEAEFYIYNELGQLVCVGASGPYHNKHFDKKIRKIRIEIGPLILTSGKYRIRLDAGCGGRCDTWENAIGFTITECQPFATHWEIPAFREGVCILNQSFCEVE